MLSYKLQKQISCRFILVRAAVIVEVVVEVLDEVVVIVVVVVVVK